MKNVIVSDTLVYLFTASKVSKYGVFSGPYFPAFGLNTERYSLSLRIQSECGKIRTRKTPYLATFHALAECRQLSKTDEILKK